VKIRVQSDHHAVFERRSAQNLLVGRLGQADFPRVDRIEPRLAQERRAGAGRALEVSTVPRRRCLPREVFPLLHWALVAEPELHGRTTLCRAGR